MINAYRKLADSFMEGLEGKPTPPKPPRKQHPILAAVLVILLLWALAHVYSAEHTKNNPPAACQLLGGTWDPWHGWQCDLPTA